jgi:hypothetical protein
MRMALVQAADKLEGFNVKKRDSKFSERIEKKPYLSPALTKFGHAVDLTKGELLPGEDNSITGDTPAS